MLTIFSKIEKIKNKNNNNNNQQQQPPPPLPPPPIILTFTKILINAT